MRPIAWMEDETKEVEWKEARRGFYTTSHASRYLEMGPMQECIGGMRPPPIASE